MRAISQSPSYNLKAVLKETGLTADVLRAWERRYDLPKPQRTAGGHRLYSEYDIETVKWLKARQAEGLTISRAVKMWNDMLQTGRDPLAGALPVEATFAPERMPIRHAYIESLRRRWVQSCLAFDERDAEDALAEAFALFPVETVCVEILQQGLTEIGSGWYHDRVSVQQEHFASAQAVRRIDALITAAPRPTRRLKVLVGCPPGEWHSFPALMLSLLLRRAGIEVIYLGANIAIEQLAETAAAIRPDLIVLAAQQLTTAASLLDTFLVLGRQKIPLAYGGLIFNRIPGLVARIPAHFLGDSLEGAVSAIEGLMLNPQRRPETAAVDERYRGLARLYQERRPAIENRLYAMLQSGEMRVDYLADANHFLGGELWSALELGDPALLEADLEWVRHMLAGRRIPPDQLKPYLAAYRQAIQAELGPVSAPVTDWMADFIQRNGDARP